MANDAQPLIRRACPADAGAIARLFYRTVHTINARDYTPAQLNIWAPAPDEALRWRRRIRRSRGFVAQLHGRIVGFAIVDVPRGYVQAFFVAADRQRQGIGARLMRCLAREARKGGGDRLWAHVSITAEPFFRRMGFQRLRRTTRYWRNQRFRQYLMARPLCRRGHDSGAWSGRGPPSTL